MIEHSCADICVAYGGLSAAITQLENLADPAACLDDRHMIDIANFALVPLSHVTADYPVKPYLHEKTCRLGTELGEGKPRFTGTMLLRELRSLRDEFILEWSVYRFAFIPSPYAEYFERDKLFGERVDATFLDARLDIRAAGNCIAAELDTAAVFHLMRTAEFGLRALAKRMKVHLSHKGAFLPLELADWQAMLTAINNKIAAHRRTPKGSKGWQDKLEMLSDAAEHCAFMKDIWRNSVCHTRKSYQHPEAVAAFNRVREFMQFLVRAIKPV
jgi:hypothetical protein